MTELIVYACPTGALADGIQRYFALARAVCGDNGAHHYPPHCSLTGFFHDTVESIPLYTEALATALSSSPAKGQEMAIAITGMRLEAGFHGLVLESYWIKELMREFANRAISPSRLDDLRLKTDLHLSLAYGYPPGQEERLESLARHIVDPHAPVHWWLRLYERLPDAQWLIHGAWPLD